MNTFEQSYVGPRGPHLACLTQFSRTGERKERGSMRADRPRPDDAPKAKPYKGKGKLAKASAALDIRRREHSMIKDATGFRAPGSMKV